jgi:hypothetical protein
MGRVINYVPWYLTCLATFALCLLLLRDLHCFRVIQIQVTVMTHHWVVSVCLVSPCHFMWFTCFDASPLHCLRSILLPCLV